MATAEFSRKGMIRAFLILYMLTAVAGDCTMYADKYYQGALINSYSDYTPGECCDLCSNIATCAHWSVWGNDNVCYLYPATAIMKNWTGDTSGDSTATTTTTTAPTTTPNTRECTTYTDKFYGGVTEISVTTNSTVGECCDLCSNTPACAHWFVEDYTDNSCYLMPEDSIMYSWTGDIAGDSIDWTPSTGNGLSDSDGSSSTNTSSTNNNNSGGSSPGYFIVGIIVFVIIICCCGGCCMRSGGKEQKISPVRQADRLGSKNTTAAKGVFKVAKAGVKLAIMMKE